jgi:hypothetical protein
MRKRLPVANWAARAVLAALLGLATYPAWRVLWLGASPTLAELLTLRCSSR